jgi:hypothetical protein
MIGAPTGRCHRQSLDPPGSFVIKTRLTTGYDEDDGHEIGS